jgi:hypothetical protein
VEGRFEDLDLSSIQKNRHIFDKLKDINNTKSKFFVCQIGGSPLIDNTISITELPKIMSLDDAKEYLTNNILLDVSGEIVVNISAPFFPK